MRDHAPLSDFRYGMAEFQAFDAVIAEMNQIVGDISGAAVNAAETMESLASEIANINPKECRALKELLITTLPTMKVQMEDLKNGLVGLKERQKTITASAQAALDLATPPSDDSSSVQDAPP